MTADDDKVALDDKVGLDDKVDLDETVGLEETAAEPEPESVAPTDADSARGSLKFFAVLGLAVLLVASAGVTAWFYFATYRSDEKVDQATAATVIQSAADGAVALLSYTPETLDEDFTNAKARLTGDFLNYYTQFTQEIVTPAAKQKSVKTSAAVVRSALSKIEPTTAEVLLFINQSTVSKENPDGSFTASSVKVEMTKVGDDWLISSFDPV